MSNEEHLKEELKKWKEFGVKPNPIHFEGGKANILYQKTKKEHKLFMKKEVQIRIKELEEEIEYLEKIKELEEKIDNLEKRK